MQECSDDLGWYARRKERHGNKCQPEQEVQLCKIYAMHPEVRLQIFPTLQFAGFCIMICRHLAHCKYLAGPSTLVFLAGCKPPHFCCFFCYCSEQLAYIFHVPNKLKIILLSGIMF